MDVPRHARIADRRHRGDLVDRAGARLSAGERTEQAFSMIERVGVLHAQTEQGAAQILDAAAELNRQAAALQHGARQFTRRVRAA